MLLGSGGIAAVALARAPQTLVFYSAQGYDSAEAAAFQKATGIHVELSDMSTGPLLAKVQAERDNPRWDVVWFDGNDAMATLDRERQLLRGWVPANVSRYTTLGMDLMPVDDSYFPTGVTAAGVIIYNRKAVPAKDAPTTWTDLTKPFFRNAVGMNNPAISGPTYPVVAGIMDQMGTTEGEAFFRALKANGLLINQTNGVTLQALTDGRIKAAIVQDSAALGAAATDPALKVVYPPTGVFLLPSDVAISAHAPDMAAAKRFVNFVLSPEGQHVMQDEKLAGSDSLFQPVTRGLRPLVRRPANIVWIENDPVWWGEQENSLLTWFTDNIVR
jgi:iron(III) transport system substrate-binding protein